MPFFNHGVFVGDAVESVRKQSRAVDQIVIVDDGSTDPHSLAELDALAGTGVTVVRQSNQGPGAARNLGVRHTDGDAVFFLDSDDTVTERHVEISLGALADAPDDVGFVYPDMQFHGNERDLVVMPPYNLYMLLDRNFCCMGGLVDRAVFEAGHEFRADLRHGHEDWDFFITLGERGIFGRPFHGAPLLYRRWGYSRSDGVKEKGTFLREVRDLHPRLNDSRRLVEIKREWAPALSIVVPPSSEPQLADQTCDDFEVVHQVGQQAPPVRGRWVLMLGDKAGDVLTDPTFVERVVRLAADRADAIGISLHAAATPVAGWRPSTKPEAGPFLGMVVRGSTYSHWWETTSPTTAEFAPFFNHLDSLSEGTCWEYGGPAPHSVPSSVLPLSAFRPPRPPPGPVELGDVPGHRAMSDLAEQGGEAERGFRLNDTPPLLIPPGGVTRLPAPPGAFRDGLEALTERAWSEWIPSRARRLDLVVDLVGQTTLEAVEPQATAPQRSAPVAARGSVGWIWSQPFPGTTCLFSWFDLRTHSISYRVADEPSGEKGEVPMGYLATEALPGRFELLSALEECRHTLQDSQRIALPHIEGATGAVFVERVTSAPSRRPATSAPRSTVPAATRRWPLFEIALGDGQFRYTRQPDACVGRNDVLRPFPTEVAQLGDPMPGSPLSTLFEVRYSGSDAYGYTSGSELSTAAGSMYPVQAIGALDERTDAHVPLVRLSPRPGTPMAVVAPGHRLAVAWQPLAEAGYVAEGVVGYASRPDPTRLPLYRWWNVARGSWLVSLGQDESRRVPYLQFEGTLGRAWSPGTLNVGHIDLWEMEREGTTAYATDPASLAPHGFVARRIVARLLRDQEWGTVPLLSMSSEDGKRGILTTSASEGEVLGLPECRTLGYVEGAVPGSTADQGAEPEPAPAWAVAVDESDGMGNVLRGLLFRDAVPEGVAVRRSRDDSGRLSFTLGGQGRGDLLGFALGRTAPFGQPVYSVGGAAGDQDVVMSELPVEGAQYVRQVLCFLPGVEFSERPAVPAGGRGLRGAAKSMVTGSLLRKSGLARLFPGSLRRRFRQFVR
jgi:hypothetical protein